MGSWRWVRVLGTGWGAVGACLLASCSAGPPQIDAARTNVLWVTICTLRADRLGSYGFEGDVSPHLDALAERGVVFERTYTTAPLTRPAIAAMISSAHPRTLGFQEPGPWESRRRTLPEKAVTLAERLRDAGYATLGITANPNASASAGFGQGYDEYHGTDASWADLTSRTKPSAEEVAALLLARLDGPVSGRPFFAHLVLVDVHHPYEAENARRRLGDWPAPGPQPDYALQIRYVDDVIGRLLQSLEERGLSDTLVIVNSDHGEGFGVIEGDLFHGSHLYDSTIRVPWILHHPALAAQRVSEPVQSLDVVPTVLDLLGIGFDPGSVAGVSLAGRLRGEADAGPDPARGFVIETRYVNARKSAFVQDGWKLIADETAGGPPLVELYRLPGDETRSQVAGRARRTNRMLGRLARFQREHPPLPGGQELEPSEEESAALRALGYIQPDSQGARSADSPGEG